MEGAITAIEEPEKSYCSYLWVKGSLLELGHRAQDVNSYIRMELYTGNRREMGCIWRSETDEAIGDAGPPTGNRCRYLVAGIFSNRAITEKVL